MDDLDVDNGIPGDLVVSGKEVKVERKWKCMRPKLRERDVHDKDLLH